MSQEIVITEPTSEEKAALEYLETFEQEQEDLSRQEGESGLAYNARVPVNEQPLAPAITTDYLGRPRL